MPESSSQPVVIVSGLPRSGTSMMMQALAAGGMEFLTDGLREADEDNPKGYYELEKVKKLAQDASWIHDAEGKAIKVISMLLFELPAEHDYKIIFVTRDMSEILASQRVMWERLNPGKDTLADSIMAGHYEKHLAKLNSWLSEQANMDILYIDYNATLVDPSEQLTAVHAFLGGALDLEQMIAVVDPALYRQKK